MPFADTWRYLETRLHPGDSVRNWTKDRGYLGDEFTVTSVTSATVAADAPGAVHLQRIPKEDFERVYNIWAEYLMGTFPRHRMRDEITRFSKYIIAILHWVQDQNEGGLP